MSYADGLLSTGERIVHRARQHWLVLLWGARLPIAAIVASLLLVILSQNTTSPFRDWLFLLTAALAVGGLAFLLWATLHYMSTEFILTNRRVVQAEGVLNKRATDSSLEKINDAVLTQSVFGRILGFGDLDILTAAEQGIERFRMIVDPIGFKRAMLDAKHEYEIGMEREGWAPSPPIRASAPAFTGSAPGSASSATATAASAHQGAAVREPGALAPAALAPRADPEEVTRTLASLADLRDRGAITAVEFDEKKADLLARL